MPQRIFDALASMRRIILYGGLVILVLFGLLAYVVFTDRHNESNRRDREATNQIQARVESCHQYNTDQTRDRNFQVKNILTLTELSGRITVEEAKARPEFQQYVDFINNSFPYRQCSAECVKAYYDPMVPDCEPARNEIGNP